jgi:hypothetical protein
LDAFVNFRQTWVVVHPCGYLFTVFNAVPYSRVYFPGIPGNCCEMVFPALSFYLEVWHTPHSRIALVAPRDLELVQEAE